MKTFITVFVGLVFCQISAVYSSPDTENEITHYERQCFDVHRRPVLNVRNDTLNDVAHSDLIKVRGAILGPLIVINVKWMKELSKASQMFFVAHECGHHALGHLYQRKLGNLAEQEADCYAVRTLIRQGEFTLQNIAEVQTDMHKFARASIHHKGGDKRAASLMGCLDNGIGDVEIPGARQMLPR